jgi:pimeloyl-ACP methyl ester carboxylesterase
MTDPGSSAGRVDVDGVIVPDLRGYGRSGKPEAVKSHAMPVLAADVKAILADLGIVRAHIVGHDLGGSVAWALAAAAPASVDHLVVLFVGHPATFLRMLQQRERSWYMLLFDFPDVAERWLTGQNWADFRAWTRHPDSDQVIADLEATGSLTPVLSYYRANRRPEDWATPPELPAVKARRWAYGARETPS